MAQENEPPMQTERSAKRAYGTGSITERNGSWYGKWRLPDGRQVQRRLGAIRTRERPGLTKAQAEAALRERMETVTAIDVASVIRRPHEHTMAELGALFVSHARDVRGLKRTTLTDYEMHVRLHLGPFFGDIPIQRITAERIEEFAAHLRAKRGEGRRGGKPLSAKSIQNYLGTVSALLNFAVRKKWLTTSPMTAVDLPKLGADEPLKELTFLETSEVARLVANAQPGGYHELDRALYVMAAYTGLRQGELRGLKWSHVDFGQSIVHVLENVTRHRRTSPKGKRRRSVPLAQTAATALLELRAVSAWVGSDDPVFATPSSGRPMAVAGRQGGKAAGIMGRYREALAAAELPVAFTFHDLRHTFGTTMARNGIEVGTIQAWMGHADLATTQLYMHYAPAGKDAARIEDAFGPNLGPKLRVTDGTGRRLGTQEAV
jgi:integrase